MTAVPVGGEIGEARSLSRRQIVIPFVLHWLVGPRSARCI